MRHILNIEGIPGSGKSTTAAQLDGLFRAAGINSYWVREEAQDHPIGISRVPRTDGVEKLVGTYLKYWENFISTNTRVAVLDGYALQSSVRFLFAMNAPVNVIHQYFLNWQKIGQVCSSLVFLKVEDPVKHFYNFVFPLRGENWTQRVSSYVASTPYGQERGLTGTDGIVNFWSDYQTLCLELLNNPMITVRIQNYTDRGWIGNYLESMHYAGRDQL